MILFDTKYRNQKGNELGLELKYTKLFIFLSFLMIALILSTQTAPYFSLLFDTEISAMVELEDRQAEEKDSEEEQKNNEEWNVKEQLNARLNFSIHDVILVSNSILVVAPFRKEPTPPPDFT